MYIDFHTHGKLAKYLPFSEEYTLWLLSSARKSGLDALCMTEHFNTEGFDEVYGYVAAHGKPIGDAFEFNGLLVFPGMETDIAEGGHILCLGPMAAIRELNRDLEPYKKKGDFLPFADLLDLFEQYPVIVGAGHPFREGGHIPELPKEQLDRLDFLDLNGKDIAVNRHDTEKKTEALGSSLNLPLVAGSDTHQAVQYGCIRTHFDNDITTLKEMRDEMQQRNFHIDIHPDAAFKVQTAELLKRSLKEVHALGGDYVSVLVHKGKGESPAVLAAKERCKR